MEFMGYELEELKGATAILRNGSRQLILNIRHYLLEGWGNNLNLRFFIEYYHDELSDTYTEDGTCNLLGVDTSDYDIVSIELAEDSKDLTKDEEIRNLVTLMRMHCETKQVASSNFVQTTCNQILDLLDS